MYFLKSGLLIKFIHTFTVCNHIAAYHICISFSIELIISNQGILLALITIKKQYTSYKYLLTIVF